MTHHPLGGTVALAPAVGHRLPQDRVGVPGASEPGSRAGLT